MTAFLDRESLHLGDQAVPKMEAAVRTCQILVIVLTKDWLRKEWTTLELHWALDQRKQLEQRRQPAAPLIMPLYCGVSIDEVGSPTRGFKKQMRRWHGALANQRLQNLRDLSEISGLLETALDR